MYLVIAVVQVSRNATRVVEAVELLCLLGEQHVISGGVIVGI